MEKTKKIRKGENQSLWVNILIAGGIGLGVILLTVLISPLLLLKAENPDGLVLLTLLICVALGGFIGGFISAKASDGAEIVSALLTALVMVIAILICSFLYKKGFSLTGLLFVVGTLSLSSLLGALAVLKMRNNKKHNMKKLKKMRR